MAYVIWLGVISCGTHAPDHPSIATPCSDIRVGQVLVTGAPASSVPALRVLAGTIDDPLRADRIVAFATDRLHTQGFARANIELTRTRGCFVDLHVAVALGPRFQIRAIDFQSTPTDDFPARDRLAALEDALGTVNTIGGVYVDYRLRRALADLQQRYRDAGWLEATIADPIAHYTEDGGVTIAIPVTPGPRFRVAAIRARGAGERARAAVLEEIAIEPGAWYDGVAVRTGIERARRKLDRWVELRTTVSQDRGVIELEAILESSR